MKVHYDTKMDKVRIHVELQNLPSVCKSLRYLKRGGVKCEDPTTNFGVVFNKDENN